MTDGDGGHSRRPTEPHVADSMIPVLGTTSFDRYARYSYVHRVRRAWFGSGPIRILDVGDPYGVLAGVFPGDHTVSLDLYVEGAPVHGMHNHLLGSGFSLPFADATFDLVASHDVLEHVPADRRDSLVAELLRVGRGPVVLVAPFAEPRTERCEQIVNAYYVTRTGTTLQPLDEHADGGLPELDWLCGWLRERGVAHTLHSDGWLYHWLAFMLLKAHFVAEGQAELDRAVDLAFNTLLRDRDRRGPHYRRAVLLRPPSQKDLGLPGAPPPPGDVEGDLATLTLLGWEIARALPAGCKPAIPDSPFRRWVDDRLRGDGPVSELARSLDIALDAAGTGWPPLVSPLSPSRTEGGTTRTGATDVPPDPGPAPDTNAPPPLVDEPHAIRGSDGDRAASPGDADVGELRRRVARLEVLNREQHARLQLYETSRVARLVRLVARWIKPASR